MAALLALAVVSVLSPLDHGFASSVVHAASDAPNGVDTHPEANSPDQSQSVNLAVDCQVSTIACCGLAHCQPAISSDPHEMTFAVADAVTPTAAAVRRSGGVPKVIPPPPRRAPV